MAVHRIAVIGGDGIGPEVIDQAVRVADAAARKHDGGRTQLEPPPLGHPTTTSSTAGCSPPTAGTCSGRTTPSCSARSASPDVPDKITVHELLLPMRRKFDQYVNLRPGVPVRRRALPARRQEARRASTCSSTARTPRASTPRSAATSTPAPRTRSRCRPACSPAGAASASSGPRSRPPGSGRGRSSPASPSRTPRCTAWGCGTTPSTPSASDYPDVQSSSLLVDAAAMDFVRKPEAFDVVVASNLFGDILTDLSAAVTGSIGLASQREHQPDEAVPEHVRAGPRQRPGHRRQGDRQPDGGRPLGRR